MKGFLLPQICLKIENVLSFFAGSKFQQGYILCGLQVLMALRLWIRSSEIRSSANPQGLGWLEDDLYLPLKDQEMPQEAVFPNYEQGPWAGKHRGSALPRMQSRSCHFMCSGSASLLLCLEHWVLACLSIEVSFLLLKWDGFSNPPSFLHMWTQWLWEHLQYTEVSLGWSMGRCSGVEHNLGPTKPKDGDIPMNSPKISCLPDVNKQIRFTFLSALHASPR